MLIFILLDSFVFSELGLFRDSLATISDFFLDPEKINFGATCPWRKSVCNFSISNGELVLMPLTDLSSSVKLVSYYMRK